MSRLPTRRWTLSDRGLLQDINPEYVEMWRGTEQEKGVGVGDRLPQAANLGDWKPFRETLCDAVGESGL